MTFYFSIFKMSSRAGKKWTAEEDQQLIDSLNSKTSIEDIAEEHKRTVRAIKSRIKKNVVHVPVHVQDMCKLMVALKLKEIDDFLKKKGTTAEQHIALLEDLNRLTALI